MTNNEVIASAGLDNNEAVIIEIDLGTREIKGSVKEINSVLTDLKKLTQDITLSFSRVCDPIIASIENMQTGMRALTDAIVEATDALTGKMIPAVEQITETDWVSSVSTAIDETMQTINMVDKELGEIEKTSAILQKFIDAIKNSSGSIAAILVALLPKTAGVFTSVGVAITSLGQTIMGVLEGIQMALGISVGWVIAIIAAVIAAIVAVIVYWDEIKYFFTDTLPQLWAKFVEWVSGIAGKVAEVFSSAMSAIGTFFADCWNAIVSVFSGIGQWIQENVIQPIVDYFTPAIEWLSELFNSIRQTISDVFYNIGVIISGYWEILKVVWGVVAEWFDVNVIQPVTNFFVGMWTGISTWAVNTWNDIVATFTGITVWFYQNVTQPVQDFFIGMWSSFSNAAVQAWEGIKAVFSKVTGFFKDVFTKAWSTVVNVFSTAGEIFTNIKDGILSAFKNIVNGIIKGLNNAIAVPFNGINTALGAIRDINILGLTPFSGLRTISVPQIPYLAQGAVLPANRPFLAVVGDQRHGTNVEAPLATIQEAVAVVIDDYIGAMMAGFEALLAEQKATRQAVESIHIGDDVLYKAVQRRSRVMAIARGGL